MLRWAFIFLALGLIAGLLGYTDVEGTSVEIVKVLFFLFLALVFVVMAILGLTIFRSATRR